MNTDIWNRLAKKLAKRISPYIEFKGGNAVDEEFLTELFEKEIKNFAEEYIVRVFFTVKNKGDKE